MRSRNEASRSAHLSSPKSKHISKFNHPISIQRAPRLSIPRQEVAIYHESSEEKSIRDYSLKHECQQALLATLKIESPEEKLSSQWMKEDEHSESPPLTLVPCGRSAPQRLPIIRSQRFRKVQQIDFELYCTFLVRTKIYGALMMDHCGRLLWCDKTAHELLEGSLNNFQRTHVTDLLLNCQLPGFLQQLNSIEDFNEGTILQWIIYSKNSKRRYKTVTLPKRLTSADIFYRFLKALTVRIRPISIGLPDYRDSNGFCNEKLFVKDQPMNCFFVEVRLTKRSPDFTTINIHNDLIIKKFIRKAREDQSSGKDQLKIKIEDEGEDPIEAIVAKTKTIYGGQEFAMSMEGEKQAHRVETAINDDQKIGKQHQKASDQLQ